MQRTFKGSLYTLGVMFIIASILFGMLAASPEGSLLNSLGLGGFISLLCASPLVMLVTAVSGIGTLINHFSGQEKRKREYGDFILDSDDYRLDEIMTSLTPEQQVYLENRLRNERLGVGSDGELMSINDLLDEFEGKEKRK